MITQSCFIESQTRALHLASLGNPETRQLQDVLEAAAIRQRLPTTIVGATLSRQWGWEPMTDKTAQISLASFQKFHALLSEARCIASFRISRGEDRTTLASIDALAKSMQRELEGDFLIHLAAAEKPLEVIKGLLRISPQALRSEMLSALLGVQEESVGGDLRRHPMSEQRTLYGRGGCMYQASDPHELWPVFSLLNFKSGAIFFDLGSGYGHVLFCGALARPDMIFKGIELMSVRVHECEVARSRLGISNASFAVGDVTKGGFEEADIIFLFNPFPPDTREEVSNRVERLAQKKPLAVIDYEGLVTQDLASLRPISVRDMPPYRILYSRHFSQESQELLGLPVLGNASSSRRNKGA